MYRVTCKQCGASGIAEDGNRLQQSVGCSCCTQPHDHDRAANLCPGATGTNDHAHQHTGAACLQPGGGTNCQVITGLGEDCPGGHCFPGVDGCTSCRPLDVTWLGEIRLQPVGGPAPSGQGFLGRAIGAQLLLAKCYLVFRLAMASANMTDRNTGGNNLVNWLLQAIYCLTATTTYTPGTGGGSAKTVTPPFLLALMGTAGSNTANGTELANGNGYTNLAGGGKSMGSPAFGNPSAGVIASSNSQSWTATAGWSAALGIEIWDSAATKLRYLQGGITSVTLANGNTLTFPAGSITADGSQW